MKQSALILMMVITGFFCFGQSSTDSVYIGPSDSAYVGSLDSTKNRSQLSENSAGSLAVSLAATSKVPVSMVRHVRQASNGDILIASYLGVFRYDARLNDAVGQARLPARAGTDGNDAVGQGKLFTNISSEISPPRFSSFWDVLEDRKGNLWFGTRDSGVYYLPAGQTTFQHFTTKDGLASNMALHFYEDRAGNIWFGANRYDARLNDGVGQARLSARAGTDGNGEVGQRKFFRTFTTKDGFPSNSIRLLLEDKTGKLWFGAQGENMFVYDARLNGEIGQARPDSIGRKTFTVLKNKDGKTFNNVWSVFEDKKGNIWFGDTNGFWRYDGTTFTKVSERGAYAIIQDKKGNIWTTGDVNPPNDSSWALSRYDAKSLYNKQPTVTEIMSGQPGLLGLLEANDGSIWFGSYKGVYRYDARLPARAGTDGNDGVGQGKTITDFKSKEERQ